MREIIANFVTLFKEKKCIQEDPIRLTGLYASLSRV